MIFEVIWYARFENLKYFACFEKKTGMENHSKTDELSFFINSLRYTQQSAVVLFFVYWKGKKLFQACAVLATSS